MKNILTIQTKLKTLNKKLYIVGGFCREMILGNENEGDIDLVTDATPDEMKKVLKIVGEVGKKYGTCIVSEGGDAFELTTFRRDIGSINHRKPAEVEFTDSLEEDAQRRDFSCNAIYFDPKTKEFIDPTGGIQDLNKGIIRFVGNIEDRIEEDALRILRFIRFKNRYGFEVADKKYWEVLSERITLLKNIPMERIRQELDKILLDSNNIQALEDLKAVGFLNIFLPELDCLDQFPGNKHHLEGDVWIHTKMCIGEMNDILQREKINGERKLMLLWSILLHDIGKAPTFTVGEDGQSHYYDHENVGAEMFQADISERLKFSNELKKKIFFCIREHMRVFMIPDMRILKARKLMMHPYFQEVLLVGEADNKGRRPQKLKRFDEIQGVYSAFQSILKKKKFWSGDEIILKYPHLDGKRIGEKMQQLNDQILVED